MNFRTLSKQRIRSFEIVCININFIQLMAQLSIPNNTASSMVYHPSSSKRRAIMVFTLKWFVESWSMSWWVLKDVKNSFRFLLSNLQLHNGLRCTKRGVIRLDAAFEIRTFCSRIRANTNLLEKLRKFLSCLHCSVDTARGTV